MVKQWIFKFKKQTRRLSLRAGFFAFLAVLSSLVSVIFAPFVPDRFSDLIGGKAVDGILSIMASSMLIVTTFAMSNMVAAYSAATQTATPRATGLIKDDSKTQFAISIFLGAFIYSIVSIIALSTAYYGEKGRAILLFITILVLLAVVWVMIKWVDQLRSMSSVSDTIQRVEQVTTRAFRERAATPTFGCNLLASFSKELPSIKSDKVGFIQNIDIDLLGNLAKKYNIEFIIDYDIGSFVHFQTSLIYVRGGEVDDNLIRMVLGAFSIGSERTFESDPLYGVTVLSGIGIKAMSPSLNDPGTAIDVVASLVRLILDWQFHRQKGNKASIKYDRIFFPEIKVRDVVHESFFYLTRQSLSSLQVIESLKQALQTIDELGAGEFREVAQEQLEILDSRVKENITLKVDLNQSFHEQHKQ